MGARQPVLRGISPEATPEEVAAVVAAITQVSREFMVAADAPESPTWVRASRLRARRAGLSRGPWRLSGRAGRRARA